MGCPHFHKNEHVVCVCGVVCVCVCVCVCGVGVWGVCVWESLPLPNFCWQMNPFLFILSLFDVHMPVTNCLYRKQTLLNLT